MEMPCFVDGWGILVCLSMKVPCFMDERGFEEGCPQNRAVFDVCRVWKGWSGG